MSIDSDDNKFMVYSPIRGFRETAVIGLFRATGSIDSINNLVRSEIRPSGDLLVNELLIDHEW
jgi:hypothetical protein